jgi:hypothetical protein
LAISRVPSIAIDPAFAITYPVRCDLQLVRATSDDHFAGGGPIRHLQSGRNPWRNLRRGRPLFDRYLGGTHLDLAFIDGMHLFEYVLRDFMNVERYSTWSTVIAFDDMLPRDIDEAARDRHTEAWTGDVYKLIPTLARYRPDLIALQVDTQPTGILVVLGADATNVDLRGHYNSIVADQVVPDPQPVPTWVLERQSAVAPEALLSSGLWAELVKGRRRHQRRAAGLSMVAAQVEGLLPDRTKSPDPRGPSG